MGSRIPEGVEGPVSLRVSVARASLLEIGRPDLADRVMENKIGDPSIRGGIFNDLRPVKDSLLIIRALKIGHLSDPEGADVVCPKEVLVTEDCNIIHKCERCNLAGFCDADN